MFKYFQAKGTREIGTTGKEISELNFKLAVKKYTSLTGQVLNLLEPVRFILSGSVFYSERIEVKTESKKTGRKSK